MKKILKKILKFITNKIVNFLYLFNAGRYLLELIQIHSRSKKYSIYYKENRYDFFIPNRLNYFRAKTFLTKEPETIEWIEKFKEKSVFWDIGSNIGLYSCFASKERDAKTFSFEPSLFNLELLSKNIFLNQLSEKVIIVPLSLTDKLKISNFNMSNTESGGSMSTFSEKYSHDGKLFNSVFKYKTIGISGNDFVKKLNIDKPNYIKIDVDGIEHLILIGLDQILDKTKSILIEVNEKFELQKNNIKQILESQGFFLDEKRQSEMVKCSKLNSEVYNQIWSRRIKN